MMVKRNLTAIAMAASLVVVAGCQNDPDERFDPRGLGNRERDVSGTYQAEPPRPLPTTMQSKYLGENIRNSNYPDEPPAAKPLVSEKKMVRIPLREITQRAVANSLSVKVSGYTPAIDETRTTEAEARFDPELRAGLTYRNNRQSQLFFGAENDEIWQGEAAIVKNLESGGELSLSVKPSRVHFIDTSSFTPTDVNRTVLETSLELTQPLLRDFGTGVNRARITINQNNQRISVLDFRKDLEEMLRNVEEIYWRLQQAQQNVQILERLLDRTMSTANIIALREGQDSTLEQTSNAISKVESARTNLIRARQQVYDLSDRLKNLMNDPEFPVAGDTLILPSDEPLAAPVSFDFSDSINTALLNRFELGQQLLRVDSASIAMEVAKNNKLPQLNLIGSIGASGGGSKIGEDFFDAFDNYRQDNSPGISWSLGLQFSYKLANREAEAIMRRAQLQRMQAIAQYQQLIDQVSTDVKTAQREVETSWQAIAQARSSKFAASKAMEIVDILQDKGQALDRQFVESKFGRINELANAEQVEADAIAAYNIAISRYESAKGTLLRYNNVILEEKMR